MTGGGAVALRDDPLRPHREELAAWPAAQPVRLAYAASRVVLRADYPDGTGEVGAWIDWDATMAQRRRLGGLGFAIAEAMDTAQRFQIGWSVARQLIERCGALHLPHGFVAGAGCDGDPDRSAQLIDAVVEQAACIERAGGEVILLPLRWLAARRLGEREFVDIYASIVGQLRGPVYVHWLGEAFMPELAGYFPGRSFERVMDLDPAVVRGAKLSLLDAGMEVELRRRLRRNRQLLLTGDDLHFARLIAGGDPAAAETRAPAPDGWTEVGGRRVALGDFSHALLGIFDAIAEPASLALRYLAHGDVARYLELMEPCERLSRVIFEPPTACYKTGLALVAWLAGWQDNAILVGHDERLRDREHLRRVVRLAAEAGVLGATETTRQRLAQWWAGD